MTARRPFRFVFGFRSTSIAFSVAALALFASGCTKDDDEEAATASVTSALQTSQQDGITHDVVNVSSEGMIDPEKAAREIATKEPVGIDPAGCMQRTQNGGAVHFVFHGCTGPFGKVTLDGSADLTLKHDEQKHLVVTIVGGDDLRANDRELHYRANGTLAANGDARDVTWHAEASGKTRRDRDYTRSTDLAFRVDVAKRCLSGTGAAHASVSGVDLDLTAENLNVCGRACPASGKLSATLRGPLGRERSVSVTFDGSANAHVKTPKRELDVAMACEDAEAAD